MKIFQDLRHGGGQAFEFDEDSKAHPILIEDFDFDRVETRLDLASTDEEILLRLGKFDAERAMRAAARLSRKGHYGRRGCPEELVKLMYRDYQRLGSLSRVARVYKRTRQSMWDLFRSHGFKMNQRRFHAKILFAGKTFTPGKNGYYRESNRRKNPQKLHYAIWEAQHGRPVPKGRQIIFKNGDNTDFRSLNLECLPIREARLHHYRRRYPDRANFTPAELREFWKDHYRKLMRKRSKWFTDRGLRSDGKPRRRSAIMAVA